MHRPPALAHLRFQEESERFRDLDLERTFATIFETNLWGADESRSGLGSVLDATAILRTEIPALLRNLNATSLLDIPCGDFAWMSHVDLSGIDYTGADIVPEVVARNQAAYGHRFLRLDLTADPLPLADVVFCRDCLVHLSFENIFRAFSNLKRSGSMYLLTTTFPQHDANHDIPNGDWRLLNLERAPFNLPAPLTAIEEGCPENDGA
jgi:hypothetical protein